MIDTIKERLSLDEVMPIFKLVWPRFRWFLLGVVVFYALLLCLSLLRSAGYLNNIDEQLPYEVIVVDYPAVDGPDLSLINQPPVSMGELVERHEAGYLPQIGPDGLTPFEAYRVDVPELNPDKAVLGLVVKNFGQNETLSNQYLEIAPALSSVVISPYISDADSWVRKAKEKNLEVWLEIPFETLSYPAVDTGPQTILKRSSMKLNIDRLVWALSRAGGYTGIYGHIDDSFKYSDELLVTIFQEIFGRGLGYIETAKRPLSFVENISFKYGAPYLREYNHLTGDIDFKTYGVEAALAKVQSDGRALISMDLTPSLLDQLSNLIDYIHGNDVSVVPASAIEIHHWLYNKRTDS